MIGCVCTFDRNAASVVSRVAIFFLAEAYGSLGTHSAASLASLGPMTAKVSVGMPAYNGEAWISQAIESLLAQTYGDFELIISDNASTDDTETICRGYASRDKRIRYYRNAENIGASDNYNAVFHYARAPYFKWASCNDTCKPTFLVRCVEVLDSRADVVLSYPRTVLFNDEQGVLEYYEDGLDLMDDEPFRRLEQVLSSMRLNNAMNGVIRSDALRETSLVKVYFSSDVVMVAELILRGKCFQVPEFLYFRRTDRDAATHLKTPDEILEHYHPKRDQRMLLQQWKLMAGYIGAVRRASLSLAQKRKCYVHLLRQCLWARGALLEDIRDAAMMIAQDLSVVGRR